MKYLLLKPSLYNSKTLNLMNFAYNDIINPDMNYQDLHP